MSRLGNGNSAIHRNKRRWLLAKASTMGQNIQVDKPVTEVVETVKVEKPPKKKKSVLRKNLNKDS